jgi:GT2 family glycosyltransferase
MVAIVILNWNGAAMMRQYLHTVIENADGAEVWVADNASTDDSMALLTAEYPTVRTLQLDKNYGFAEGYNRALQQIEADYYVLLNSDVEVTPHWLEPLTAYMEAHDDVAACQPKLLSLVHREEFEYAGAAGGFLDRYGYPFCRGRIFDVVERDEHQYDEVTDLLWATGACLMIRSKDYWGAGGLDGRFFAHNEEIDLCWRLRLMWRRVVCVPQSVVYHLGGGTLPKGNPMKTFLNFRNNLTMLYKNLPEAELRHVMRARWWLDYLAAFETLIVNRNWGDCKAIFRARRAFKAWRHDFDADRRRLQQSRITVTVPERKSYSLLWQYYVKGRKTFGRLPEQQR